MKLESEWTDDCQGKKDYDGRILSISSRYYPRGGGFWLVNRNSGGVTIEENEARPEIKPHAHSSLLVWTGDGDYAVLADKEFEAETEGEVKTMVEKWASEQYEKAVEILRKAFGRFDKV